MPRKKNQYPNPADCSICYSSTSNFISSCKCLVCRPCWSQVIITQIEKSNSISETIKCPIAKCQKDLPIVSLYNRMTENIKQKIDKVTLNAYFSKAPDIRRCPQPKCNYAGIMDISSPCPNNLECQKCGTRWREKVHWTKAEKFQESIKHLVQNKNEALSSLWKRFKTKKCPSCKILITKNEGCDHMTCTQCGYGFCWICFEKYPSHNQSIHNWVFKTKPAILAFLAIITFFLILFALYLLPPVNYVVNSLANHTIVPLIRWSWSLIKTWFFWVAYQIFVLVLLNLILYYGDHIYRNFAGKFLFTTLSPKVLFGLIIICLSITYVFKLYYQMLKTGLIQAAVLFLCFVLSRIRRLFVRTKARKVQ